MKKITTIFTLLALGIASIRAESIAKTESDVPPATLLTRLLERPAIEHPEDPFVMVFFEGGDDDSRWGFALDGKMDEHDWAKALEHVGYLCPYSDFKPGQVETWGIHRRDIAVRGGQRIGRQTGGCIMGLGDARDAYAEPIALAMTYFFHDEEGDLGIPSSGGSWRLRADHIQPARMRSEPIPFLTVSEENRESRARLEFGFYLQNFIFGAHGRLLELGNAEGESTSNWVIAVLNKGGQKGTTHLVVQSQGKRLESVGLVASQAKNWQHAIIEIVADDALESVHVSINIPGIGTTSGTLPRPSFKQARLSLVAGIPALKERLTDLDDIKLFDGNTLVAHYDFEQTPDGDRVFGSPIKRVLDVSGHDRHISSVTGEGGFTSAETSGIKPEFFNEMRHYLVDDLLAVRREHGIPDPEFITNWALNNRPGRLGLWMRAGFTIGSTDYYLYGDLEPGFANLHHVLHSQRARWAEASGSPWNAVWMGHCDTQKTMSVAQWQSLATLAVLDGNRWLLFFPAMSNGHFAPKDTVDRKVMATVNADVLYGTSEVAAWFQKAASGLAKSEFHPTDYALEDPDVCVRMRVNSATGEAWFAAMSIGLDKTSRNISIRLPKLAGTVVNLATGECTAITDGEYILALGAEARPLHFQPSPEQTLIN